MSVFYQEATLALAGRVYLGVFKSKMVDFRQEFIAFALDQNAIQFGAFLTKAGRCSPYFYNAGQFNDGDSLVKLAGFYADALTAAALSFDMVFGPAYKGIPLAVATAIALADRGQNVAYAYNRKEAKDHGEGGQLVGAPLVGRVLIIDDVISAGTSVRESVNIIRAAQAVPIGVAIAFDRMEQGQGPEAAAQETLRKLGLPVVAIATLDDLVQVLSQSAEFQGPLAAVVDYRQRYGAAAY